MRSRALGSVLGIWLACALGTSLAASGPTETEQLLARAREALEPEAVPGLTTRVLLVRPQDRGLATIVVGVKIPTTRKGLWHTRTLTGEVAGRVARAVATRLVQAMPGLDLAGDSRVIVSCASEGTLQKVPLAPLARAIVLGKIPASLDGIHTEVLGSPGQEGPGSARGAKLVAEEPLETRVSINGPLKQRRASLAELATARRLEERLAEELVQSYPDPRVQVHPGRLPSEVDVFVTVATDGASDDNTPFIRDYVRHLVDTVMAGEFPGLRRSIDSVIDVEEATDPEADDHPARDNPDVRRRPSGRDVGLSRRLAGAITRALLPSFNDVRVQAYFVGSRNVEVFLWARTRGEIDESNEANLQLTVRQTVERIIDDVAPGRRLSKLSKFRITSYQEQASQAHLKVAHSVGFSAPVHSLDGQIVEVPTAHVLRPRDGQLELTLHGRTLGPLVFAGENGAKMLGVTARYREGLVPGTEYSIALSEHSGTATPLLPGTFRQSSLGLAVLTGGLKVQWPFRNNGVELAFGALVSLLSDLDRANFTPDDDENFSSAYAVWSTPFAPAWRLDVAGRLTHIFQAGLTPGSNMESVGVALDYRPYEEWRLQAELVRDFLGAVPVGDYGLNLTYPRLHANFRAVFGLSEVGDVQVYVRKAPWIDELELGAGLIWRI